MKKKICFIPFDNIDFENTEQWLSDMAKKGYRYTGSTLAWASFEKSEPKDVRYGLEMCPASGDWPDGETQEMYEKSGWKFIDCMRHSFYVYECEDASAPPLHTDPVVHAMSLKRMRRDAIWGLIVELLLYTAFITGIVYVLISGRHYSYERVEPSVILRIFNSSPGGLLLLVAVMIFNVITSFVRLKNVMKITKRIKNGETKPTKSSWSRIIAFIDLICLILIVVLNISNGKRFKQCEVADYPGEIRYLLLDEIDEDIEVGGGKYHDIDVFNYISYKSVFLAPTVSTMRQVGEMSPDGRIVLITDYYEFSLESLARIAEKELTKAYSKEYRKIILSPEKKIDGAVLFIVDAEDIMESGDVSLLLLRSGKRLCIVRYTGDEDLTEYASRYAEKLSR